MNEVATDGEDQGLTSITATREVLLQAERDRKSYAEVCNRWVSATAPIGKAYPGMLPDFEHVRWLVLMLLRQHTRGDAHLLDLGAGSGCVARLVLDEFPFTRVSLCDISENLLAIAHDELAAYAPRFATRVGDCFSGNFGYPPGTFDAVVSRLALHHGRGVAVYEDVFRRIHAWLKPGGLLVCWDHVQGDSFDLTVLNFEAWKQHLFAAGGESKHVDAILRTTHREDTPLSTRQYLHSLEAAGFSIVDVLWKKANLILYAAFKTAQV